MFKPVSERPPKNAPVMVSFGIPILFEKGYFFDGKNFREKGARNVVTPIFWDFDAETFENKIRWAIIHLVHTIPGAGETYRDEYNDEKVTFRNVEIRRTERSQPFFEKLTIWLRENNHIKSNAWLDWLWIEVSDDVEDTVWSSTYTRVAKEKDVKRDNDEFGDIIGILPYELKQELLRMLEVDQWKQNSASAILYEPYDPANHQGYKRPEVFLDWKNSDRPVWFVNVRTPGTTSDFVWATFEDAKSFAQKDFDTGCVSLEIYRIDLLPEERAQADNWEHLARLVGLHLFGKGTPMLLAMCAHLDEDEYDDDTATYGEKLQYMSYERIVEALNNLKENSYVMSVEAFDKKWKGQDRDEMDKETEARFLNDLYALYHYYGFLDTINSPYSEDDINGQKFEVIRPITLDDCGEYGAFDPISLPLWEIRLEKGDGSEHDNRIRYCYPEEITVLGRREYDEHNPQPQTEEVPKTETAPADNDAPAFMDPNPIHVPDLKPLYKEVKEFILTNQPTDGYIDTQDPDMEDIFCLLYNDKLFKAEEQKVRAVRVNSGTGEVEVMVVPGVKEPAVLSENQIRDLARNWLPITDENIYYVHVLFMLAEKLYQYV